MTYITRRNSPEPGGATLLPAGTHRWKREESDSEAAQRQGSAGRWRGLSSLGEEAGLQRDVRGTTGFPCGLAVQ